MRFVFIPACVVLLLTSAPVAAQVRHDARRAYQEHWQAHPEHAEQMIRQWHDRLFHHPIEGPLLARWLHEIREGIAAPLAIAHILASQEYYVSIGSTPEGYIRTTFMEIVGRRPTEAEYRFWLARLYHSNREVVAQEQVTRYPPTWVEEEPVPQYEYRRPVVSYR